MDEADSAIFHSQVQLSDRDLDMPATVHQQSLFLRENAYLPLGYFSFSDPWKPDNVDYMSLNKRKDSFKIWPEQMNPTGLDLAKSGFYYLGISDKVKCFSCGVQLHKWESIDSALVEHKRHSPRCHFLMMTQLLP